MSKAMQYISWHNDPHWVANVILGSSNRYYRLKVDWNTRSQNWVVSILQDNETLIQGVGLVLNVNILAMANSAGVPDCILVPVTENKNIERISFENMVNHEVKLCHMINREH